MSKFHATVIYLASLSLAACDPGPPPVENSVDVVPQAQLDALEKAKAVEKSMQEAVEKREQQMRERGT